MLAVGLGRAAVDKYLEDGIDIAFENSPHSTVLSGNESILTRVLDRINHDQPDTFASRLDVETAYHSRTFNRNNGSEFLIYICCTY
jgi:acyl transferase domain-containing protein